MEADLLLLSARPDAVVPPGLARRVRLRWEEERAAAAAYRRWTACLAVAAVLLGVAAATISGEEPLDDPFDSSAADLLEI